MGIYLLKVNNRNTRTRCEICSKLTIKTPERRQWRRSGWRRSGVFIVNFEHISHLILFLLLTLNMLLPSGYQSERLVKRNSSTYVRIRGYEMLVFQVNR